MNGVMLFGEAGTGMSGFVQALTAGITPDALWGALTTAAGIIVFAVIFGFAYRVIKRAVNGISKGKGKAL